MMCSYYPKPLFRTGIIKWRVSCYWFIHDIMNILWQAGDLNLKWLYTVQPLFYIFVGAT